MSAFRSISYDMDLFAPGRVAAGLIHMSGVAGYRKCGVLGALLRKVGRVAKSKHKAVQCARRWSARGAWSSSGCLGFFDDGRPFASRVFAKYEHPVHVSGRT